MASCYLNYSRFSNSGINPCAQPENERQIVPKSAKNFDREIHSKRSILQDRIFIREHYEICYIINNNNLSFPLFVLNANKSREVLINNRRRDTFMNKSTL